MATEKTASTKRKSKTFTISLPPELAAKAEAMATRDSRTISELFREAFRAYWSDDIFRSLEDVRAYAATRNPHGYTEEDIPRLIKKVRAEEAAERAAGQTAKAS